ncbi:hypothetical protein NQ315_004622 [Exocentrus adspersus]|uniref:Alpha-mannosidase n=1 Tax=Exocentrus adspersus TaxID=1586481 RepID=A0AAV8VNW3_9CUCU|nr:hypothetical protein NQ315_004622 [Exocentrus adspersus]
MTLVLNDTLGKCGRPRIGWQIDPFGHSREQASIFKQMGYDAFFFVRLSKSVKDQLILDSSLEFLWKSSAELDNSEIFTSIFSTDSYFAPSGFCWDYLQCNSDAINDDPESFDYNLEKKVEEFSEFISNYSKYYRTNNILFGMGGDFQYQSAERNYMNLDKLIKGFQNNNDYNVFYSTPSCYYEAVMSNKPNLSTFTDDFFPYAENDHAFWSGYYTSRSTSKRFERTGNNILQGAQHLNAFSKMRNLSNDTASYENNVRMLREVMGIMQHHDAITGTEKQHVFEDYTRMLTKAIKETEKPLGNIIGNLLKRDNVTEDVTLPLLFCLLTNTSICDISLKDKYMVTVYNPLPRNVTYYVRLPAENSTYNITGPDGQEIYDIVTHMIYPVNYSARVSEVELVFAAKNVPPLGIKYYYVEKLTQSYENNYAGEERDDNKVFGTNTVGFTLDDNNLLESVTMNSKTVKINQRFMIYVSNNGTGDSIASGAYLFRPINGSDAYNINYFENGQVNQTTDDKVSVTYNRGNLVDEVIQVFNKWLTQSIRVYKGEDNGFIEFDWLVGPLDNDTIDTEYNHGKEVISRFYVNDLDNDVFYTDSNGRELIERKRTDYPYNNDSFEPVTSNYYPVTSKIVIKDESKNLQVAVLTDRSQGGSSLWGGEIELMIHRRTLRDDYKGVDEPLQETEFGKYLTVRGQHYLVLGSTGANGTNGKSSSAQERELALKKLLQPLIFVGDASSNQWDWDNLSKKINLQWSGLKTALPDNVNILNLEPWKDDSYLLRLEHIVAKGEDANHSKEVEVNIADLFSPYSISSIRETKLAANDWLSDTESSDIPKRKTDSSIFSSLFFWEPQANVNEIEANISLSPMQIRSFIIQLSK